MGHGGNRTYGQYCGLARALDVVGDRWSLLVVRELLVGPLRFSELERGLPGVARNLLAGRLRDLEGAGLLRREPVPGDARGVRYELTEWGEALRPAVRELAWWGAPLMTDVGDAHMRGRWYVVGLDAVLAHRPAPRRSILYKVCLDMRGKDEESPNLFVAGAVGGSWVVAIEGGADPDFVLAGTPPAVLAAHAGMQGTGVIQIGDVRDPHALSAWEHAVRTPAQPDRTGAGSGAAGP